MAERSKKEENQMKKINMEGNKSNLVQTLGALTILTGVPQVIFQGFLQNII